MLYLCRLVGKHSFQNECFFREGESAQEVLKELQCVAYAQRKGDMWYILGPMDDDGEPVAVGRAR